MRIFRTYRKALAWLTAAFLLSGGMLYGGYRAIRSPRVQTKLTQFIAGRLSEQLGARVEVGGVDIGFFNRLILERVFLGDLHGDTLGSIHRLQLAVEGIHIKEKRVELGRITIDTVAFFLVRYADEEKLNIQYLIDFFKSEDKDTTKAVWDLRFRELELVGAEFRYYDGLKPETPRGIDYRHLHVTGIDLLAKNLRIDHDTIHGRMDALSLLEARGFRLTHLAGDVTVSPAGLRVGGLRVKTPGSELVAELDFRCETWSDWKDFVHRMEMDVEFERSELDLEDLAHFVPVLKGIGKKVRISGHVLGPVSAIRGRGLNVWYGSGTNLQGDVRMDGLPDMDETFMHLTLRRLATSYEDLRSVPLPPFDQKRSLPIPSNMRTLGAIDFRGTFTGFISDFVANGRLKTDIGELRTDLALKQQGDDYAYSGKLESLQFNVGRFLGEDRVGKVSLSAAIDGRGLSSETVDARLQGDVASAELMGYNYRNIEVNGRFIRDFFEGALAICEDNIALTFDGQVDMTGQLPKLNFKADIGRADLHALNLLPERDGATVGGVIDADFTGSNIDNLLGRITLADPWYRQRGTGIFTFKDLNLTATESRGKKSIVLRSDIVDADFNGIFTFSSMPKAVNNILAKHLPSYASGFTALGEDLEFDFDARLKNTDIVWLFVAPKLSVSPDAYINGSYSSSKNAILLRGKLPEVAYAGTRFEGISLLAENPGKEFQVGLDAQSIFLTDSFRLMDFTLRTYTFSDSLGVNISWDNRTAIANRALITGVASFPRNEVVKFKFLPSTITVAGLDWAVSRDNLLTIDTTAFDFRNITFACGKQRLSLNGRISKDPNAKLLVGLTAFDIANFNVATKKSGLTLTGTVNGSAEVSSLYTRPFFTNMLKVDSLVVNDVEIGSGDINNTWSSGRKAVQVFALLRRGDRTGLSVVGEFMPGADRPQNFDLTLEMERLPISVAAPYIGNILSDLSGTARAELILKGTTADPDLSGSVWLDEVGLLFNYLNVRMTVNDKVTVKKNGFFFDNLRIADERGRPGKVNGAVRHKKFKDFNWEANIEVDNFLALNTTAALNPTYYGRAYATGNVQFSGKPGDMALKLGMKTERGTRLFIPLFGAKTVKESDFITFVKPKDAPVEEPQDFKADFANLTLDLDVQMTPDAEVQLIFDPTVGDIIRGRGTGDIRLALDKMGEFKMFGEFAITRGDYLFTLQNIINKRFTVRPGGSVIWSGSPYNALVNLEAVYNVRASLMDLMQEPENPNFSRRAQVEVVLKMTDDLLKPNIAFDINLPNMDESTRTDVRNRIGSGNDQEMNRQVFSLLVLNKFLPTENQNIGNEAGGFLSSSSAEMLSNQLSSWLSRISNEVDVGLNYRPGSEMSSDEVELALSTQLFNNRIIVDGNVGVANNRSAAAAGGQASNIVGDVNIEYKITPDGRFRVRAFNKSNDVNTNPLVASTAQFTQGIGLSYRKEFNTLGDLFRKQAKEARKPKVPLMLRDEEPEAEQPAPYNGEYIRDDDDYPVPQ